MQTEFEFELPKGYVDQNGDLHKRGTMRLATAADEILPRLRTLSGAFLICGDVRRLDAGTCTLLERHRVPLLAWGEQSHPLLRVLDLNAFRAGGGL